MNTPTIAGLDGFAAIPVAHVVESPHNYRKTTDKEADAQLAASVREKGVLQPLLVRPIDGQRGCFEAVFGNRRLRAARTAGLEFVPCQVRELTDLEALEAALVENVQRSDVHPIEEADGFAELERVHNYTVAEIAAKTGRSESWVRARLKLAELCDSGRKACLDNHLSATAALLVARIVPVKSQPKAIRELVQSAKERGGTVPMAEVRWLVVREFATELEDAPWKLDDAELVPAAGACSACPKRSKNDPTLFADLDRQDVCPDSGCWRSKMDAHFARSADKARAKGGRVLTEKESGQVITRYGSVQVEGFKDASNYSGVHDSKTGRYLTWADVAKKAGVPLALGRDDQGRPVELVELTPEVRAAVKATKAKTDKPSGATSSIERKAKVRAAALRLASARVAEIVTAAEGSAGLALVKRTRLALAVVDAFWADLRSKVADRRELGDRHAFEAWTKTATPLELEAAIAELALWQLAARQDTRELKSFLEAFGLDLAKLEREAVTAALAAKPKSKAKPKASSKPAAKGKGKRAGKAVARG